MSRTYVEQTVKKVGEEVELFGWIQTIRDHGKIVFVDLRDNTGLVQVVISSEKLAEMVKNNAVSREDVVKIVGMVNKRPEKMINSNLKTGTIEVFCDNFEEKFTILNKSKTPPFEITDDVKADEEIRMKYRYLDLRRPEMHTRLKLRHEIILFIRNWLNDHHFMEIETPMLTKDTPEGAREYIVPSRLQPGKGYALPQSPQQFKQLLMVGGMDRYFQLAKCLRDEDPRGDRQPEFTQLDMEMSFVEQEDVMALNEELLIAIVNKFMPQKKITTLPFPRITYKEAMEKYNTDRPDIRKDKTDNNELAFAWVVDFPFFEKDKQNKWTFTHNPFSAARSDFTEDLRQKHNIENILTTQYDVVLNGIEIGGGSIRNFNRELLTSVLEIIGLDSKQIEERFGHMLQAFDYGAPPHGGIAWGLDRLLMLFTEQQSIRDVMAFPKTGDGRDLMMAAPAEISDQILKDLHLLKTKKDS